MLTELERKSLDKLRDDQYAVKHLPFSANNRRVYPGAKVRLEWKRYVVVAVRDDWKLVLERKRKDGTPVARLARAKDVELVV